MYTQAASSPNSEILHAVWGSASNRVWAVGDNGTIVRWDGSTWAAETTSTAVTLYGLWGSSADNLWAVGDNGTILQRSAGTWTAQNSGVTAGLTSIWGSSATSAWAVGASGTILNRDYDPPICTYPDPGWRCRADDPEGAPA